jgi:hypothetical protein
MRRFWIAVVASLGLAGQVACSSSTSGASSSGTSSGGGSCTSDPTLQCDPGTDGVQCLAGGNPDANFPGYVCSDPTAQPDGTDAFCCATGFNGSTCGHDESVQGCPYPSVGFSCSGSDTPDQADANLICSTPTQDPNTNDQLFCCQ